MEEKGMSPLLFFCADHQLSEDDLATIHTVPYRRESYRKGEYLAVTGEPIVGLRMLTRGSVRTEMSTEEESLYVEELSAPFPMASILLFGEGMATFPVDVVALEECEVTIYEKADLEFLLQSCLPFLQGFLSTSARQMRRLTARLRLFSMNSIRQKIAFLILSNLKPDGSYDLGSSISDLAKYMGVRRPSLSRELSLLVSEQIITHTNGRGRLLNSALLRRICCGATPI